MMARREELMKDKDGYWSRRMAQESAASLGLQPGQAAAAAAEVCTPYPGASSRVLQQELGHYRFSRIWSLLSKHTDFVV